MNIELYAMQAAKINKLELPSDISLLDTHLFLALYSLYGLYYAGQITREQASPIKNQIMQNYNRRLADEQLIEQTRQLWKKIEYATGQYCRDPTIENADKIIVALYGTPRWSLEITVRKSTLLRRRCR